MQSNSSRPAGALAAENARLTRELEMARARESRIVEAMQKEVDARQKETRRGFARMLARKEAAWAAKCRDLYASVENLQSAAEREVNVQSQSHTDTGMRAELPPNLSADNEWAHRSMLHNGQRRISISRQTWRHEVLNTINPPEVPKNKVAAVLKAGNNQAKNQEESSSEEHESDNSSEGWCSPHGHSGSRDGSSEDMSSGEEELSQDAEEIPGANHRTLDVDEFKGDDFFQNRDNCLTEKATKDAPMLQVAREEATVKSSPEMVNNQTAVDSKAQQPQMASSLVETQNIQQNAELVSQLRQENLALKTSFKLFHAASKEQLNRLNAIVSERDSALTQARCEISEKDNMIQHLRQALTDATGSISQQDHNQSFENKEEAQGGQCAALDTTVEVPTIHLHDDTPNQVHQLHNVWNKPEEEWMDLSEDAVLQRLDGILGPEPALVPHPLSSFDSHNYNELEEDEKDDSNQMPSDITELFSLLPQGIHRDSTLVTNSIE
eukprot:g3822.t1